MAGETGATFIGTVNLSGKSTGKLDVLMTWEDPVDVVSQPSPRTLQGQAHVVEHTDIARTDTRASVRFRQEFGDTRHRHVLIKAVAATRFREYFIDETPPEEEEDPASAGEGGLDFGPAFIFPNADLPDEAAAGLLDGVDADLLDEAGAGLLDGVDAGLLDRVDADLLDGLNPGEELDLPDVLPLPSKELLVPLTRESPERSYDVLSTARPAGPGVAYVIPSFKWETVTGTNEVISTRIGGLRVYLERPWYSSGAGELLGVLLWTDNKGDYPRRTALPESLKPYISLVGRDPIWAAPDPEPYPSVDLFRNWQAWAPGQTLSEGAGSVTVVGFPVGYDEQRQLWYCDIELDPLSSYFPFVRLALARYQPKSLTGLSLSRVVMTDFSQLAPGRTATCSFDPVSPRSVTITVAGPGPTNPDPPPANTNLPASQRSYAGNRVQVSVEALSPASGAGEGESADGLAWVPAEGAINTILRPVQQSGANAARVWSGQVRLPAARGSQPYRLVIQEYEKINKDYLDAGLAIQGERLVYAAAVVI